MPGSYDQLSLDRRFEAVNERLRAIEDQLAALSSKVGVPYVRPDATVPPDVVEIARGGDPIGAISATAS